jgi:hypothetical protein
MSACSDPVSTVRHDGACRALTFSWPGTCALFWRLSFHIPKHCRQTTGTIVAVRDAQVSLHAVCYYMQTFHPLHPLQRTPEQCSAPVSSAMHDLPAEATSPSHSPQHYMVDLACKFCHPLKSPLAKAKLPASHQGDQQVHNTWQQPRSRRRVRSSSRVRQPQQPALQQPPHS